jgi:polyhydroxyalkanoate synthesis regulator phasin
MTNIGDGFKNIFLAGIGALAYTGEKGKEMIDQLVEKGEITLDQGRELNEELQRKASETTKDMRDGALEAIMRGMSPEERDDFVAKAAQFAEKQNAADAEKAVVEAELEVEEAAKDAAKDAVEEAEEVIEAVGEAVEDVEGTADKA